jgi:hypothetical protein
MAVSSLSAIAAALSTNFASDLTRLWNRQAVTVANIVPIKQGAGKSVFWTISNSGAAAGWVAEGADVAGSEYNIDDKIPMTLSRGIIRSGFALTHTEIAVALSSKGSAEALMDLLGESYLGSFTALTSTLNSALINGGGTNAVTDPIFGLVASLATTGSYAGASRVTYAGLQANVQGTVGTLTTNMLNKAFSDVFTKSGEMPEVILCSANTERQYNSLLEAKHTLQTVNGSAPAASYSLGAQPLMAGRASSWFRGVPVVCDKDMPDGTMLFLRPSELELNVLPYGSYGDAVSSSLMPGVQGNGSNFEAVPLPVRCYPVAKTGSSVKFALELECQLKLKRMNSMSVISGITIV